MGVLAGTIVSAFMISYTIYVEIQTGKDYLKSKEEVDRDASQGILLRSLMNYLQLITLIGSINVQWPNQFSSLMTSMNVISFTKTDISNIDCFFTKKKSMPMDATYAKLLLANFAPFIFCVLAILFWVCYFIIKRQSLKSRTFGDRIIVSIMIALFTLQPGAINANLKLF